MVDRDAHAPRVDLGLVSDLGLLRLLTQCIGAGLEGVELLLLVRWAQVGVGIDLRGLIG